MNLASFFVFQLETLVNIYLFEELIITSNHLGSKLMDLILFNGLVMVWSAQILWWGVSALNLPLKAAKITNDL